MNLTVAVRKNLPQFTLDVDITLPCSGIHALAGPSGAGKSTLLRLISGLEVPDAGYIRHGGTIWTDRQLAVHLEPWQRPVGMVFQDFGLFAHLNLLDNVLFATTDRVHAEALMRALDIWALRYAKPDRISGGERQRCAICQALARKPGLLLLDEPFSALDQQTRYILGDLLKETAHRLCLPMILVTHDLEEALRLSGQVLTLVSGRLATGWMERRVEEMELGATRSRRLLEHSLRERQA